MENDKVFTDPVELREYLKTELKNILKEYNDRIDLAKGEVVIDQATSKLVEIGSKSPGKLPGESKVVNMKKEGEGSGGQLKKDSMGMGASPTNKNPIGQPRGNYVGKTSAAAVTAPKAPAMPAAPKMPQLPKPPVLPKPPMAKAGPIFSKEDVDRTDAAVNNMNSAVSRMKQAVNGPKTTPGLAATVIGKAPIPPLGAGLENTVVSSMPNKPVPLASNRLPTPGENYGMQNFGTPTPGAANQTPTHSGLTSTIKDPRLIAPPPGAVTAVARKPILKAAMSPDMKTHMNTASFNAHSAAKTPASSVKMPTPEQHAQRQESYSSFTPKGYFDKAELGNCPYCKNEMHMDEC